MKLRISLVLVLTMLSVSGASGQKIKTKYDHGADFNRYKTYGWKDRQLVTRQGKENEKLIDEALVSAVNTQLRAQGLTEDQNAPDLFITYSAGALAAGSKAGTAYAPYDLRASRVTNVWTSNTIPGSVPNVWASTEGIILFEVTDARTDTVVWSRLLKKKLKNPGRMPEDLDKIVAEIARKAFQDFPPKAAKK
ncbi:MAG TPA: DUF4136 domain-containing protein [Terriglobia bacterium]|nr:DUF4136 domain-containing protein [Terriglobia bacterium]